MSKKSPASPRPQPRRRPHPVPPPLTTKDEETGHMKVLGRDVSLSAIARGTGLSMSHLCRIFGGHRTPSTRVLVQLATYLEVTTDALLTELGRIQADKGKDGGKSGGAPQLVFEGVTERGAAQVDAQAAAVGAVG